MTSKPILSAGTIGPYAVQHEALDLFANGTPAVKLASAQTSSSTGSPATSSSTSGSSNSSSTAASSSSTASKKDAHPRGNRPSILNPAGDSNSSPPQISSISGLSTTDENSNPMRIAPVAEEPLLSEPTANVVPSMALSMGKEDPKISEPSNFQSDKGPKIVSEPTANKKASEASPVQNPISNPMSTGRPIANGTSIVNVPKLSGDDPKTSKMSTDKENATSKVPQVSAVSTIHGSKANETLSGDGPETAAATKKTQAQRQLERTEQMKLRKQQAAMRKLQRQQYLKRRKLRKDQQAKKQALLAAQQSRCLAVLEQQQANGTLVLATNSTLNESPPKRIGQPMAVAPNSSSTSSHSQKKTVVHQIVPHPPPSPPPSKADGPVRTKHSATKKRSSSSSSSTESKSGIKSEKNTKSKDTSSGKDSSSGGKSSKSSGKDTSSGKNSGS